MAHLTEMCRFAILFGFCDFSVKDITLYVNTLNFPNGGEYFELEQLADVDRIEIAKLLIVHGWQLLNEKPTEDKVKKMKAI